MSQTYISPFDTPGKLDLAIIANPYPHYHRLREEDPTAPDAFHSAGRTTS